MKNRPTVEAIKKQLSNIETAEDRQAVIVLWMMDTSVDRSDILDALKELGLNDQFELLAGKPAY